MYPFFKRWSRFAGAADVGEGGLVAGVPIGAAGGGAFFAGVLVDELR